MFSANEKIQDRTISHMIYLERLKISEIRRLRNILDSEILPDIADRLERRLNRIIERGSDLGPSTTARLKDLEKELTKLSDALAKKLQAAATSDIPEMTKHEIDWQASVIRESLQFNLEMVMPNPRAVAALIKKTSFVGLKLDDWFDGIGRATQKNIMIAVNRGIVEGETTPQIIKRVRGSKAFNYTDGIFQTTRRQVETVTRSVINHATNQARIEFFKENSDIIDGLKWIATLDSRTSTVCAGLDGKVFPVDKGPRPPAHPNCRSTMTAVLKSAAELGLNDIPEAKRASINGQVPASTTYGEWLRRQPVAVQNDVLGATRAALFRDGKLPIERFTDSNLKPLTLEQLRKKEKGAFERAGLSV